MWLEMKVNTGREQLCFRFVLSEAESAKTRTEGDSSAAGKEKLGDSFPQGGGLAILPKGRAAQVPGYQGLKF